MKDECGCDICKKPSTCTILSSTQQGGDSIIYESGDRWINENNCKCVCEVSVCIYPLNNT